MGQKGFTLVELVIAVAVVGIAFYSIFSIFITAAPQNISAEDMARTAFLANRVLEETLVKGYVGAASCEPTAFSTPFSQYKYQVSINYVSSSEPDTDVLTQTSYKKVKAKVWGGISGTVEVVTLLGTYAY